MATAEYFWDRERERRSLERVFREGGIGFVEGPRRVGKTSLALLLKHALEEQDHFRIGYLDLRTVTTANLPDRLLTVVTEVAHRGRVLRMADRLHALIGWFRVQPQVVGTFDNSGNPKVELRFQEYRQRDETTIYEDIVKLLLEAPTHAGAPVALILDEFQEIMSLAPNVPALLKAGFFGGRQLSIVLMGSQQSLLARIAHSPSAPLYRIGPTVRVGTLPRDVVRAEIRKRFGWSAIAVSDEIADHIYDACDGIAQDIQTVCAVLFDRCRSASWWQIGFDELSEAMTDVVEEVSARFDTAWAECTQLQRELLMAIALHGGSGITSEAFLNKMNPHRRRTSAAVISAARSLRTREIIEATDRGQYRFKDPFFAMYLRQIGS
ncbi:MAG: ATP-binding protein [Chloroflexi bacterium]|nr:ATP-binding protein [Chloroflexota bacterium]